MTILMHRPYTTLTTIIVVVVFIFTRLTMYEKVISYSLEFLLPIGVTFSSLYVPETTVKVVEESRGEDVEPLMTMY